MGDAREANEGASDKASRATGKGGPHWIVLVLVTVVTVVGVASGIVFWLMKTGRLPVHGGVTPVEAAAKIDPPKTRMLALEPLLVNLADAGGGGYLRVVVVLRIEDPVPAKGDKAKEEAPSEKGKTAVNEDEVRMRDAALTVLGRETSDRLLEPEGKDRLKAELREGFSTHVPDIKVTDILYTEFLVQR